MQTVSAAFTTHAGLGRHRDVCKFEVQWNGTDWVDESVHVLAHDGDVSLAETGTGELSPLGTTDKVKITLKNYQWRFSPLHVGGDDDIRTYIDGAAGMHGIACRLGQGFATTSTAITAWADLGGGLVRGTAASHGLEVGDYVRVQGSGEYNGRYTVAAKAANTFDIAASWGTNTARGRVQKIEVVRAFTGVIYGHSEDTWQKTVDIEVRDVGFSYLQARASTAIYENQRVDQWLATLATLAGIASTLFDTGLHRISYCWLDDESILEDMREAAAAAGGRLYFDHSGTLRYEEPTHWLSSPHTASVWTLDAGDGAMTPEYDAAEIATEIVVETSPRAPLPWDVIYTLDGAITIPPSSTVTFQARLQTPATVIDDLVESDFYLSTAGGHPMRQYCTITLTKYGQRTTVQIDNAHTSMAADLTFFQLRGSPLGGAPSEQILHEIVPPAIAATRTRSLRDNAYVQTAGQAGGLASYLADRYRRMIPVWAVELGPGASLPHVELGDRITFSDKRIVSAARDGFVTGIAWRFDAKGYGQTLTLLDAADLYSGGPYFVIGSTALGSGEAWH